MILPSY